MKCLFLGISQMSEDGINYNYKGLKTNQFINIRYNSEATEAVVKTLQEDIPEGIKEITEDEFNNYAAQWPQPVQPEQPVEQPQTITLQELNDKVDLLIQMQLEKEGIL